MIKIENKNLCKVKKKKVFVKKLWIEDNSYDGKTGKQWENSQVNSYAPVMSSLLVMLRDK